MCTHRGRPRERASKADLIISLLGEITVRGLKPTTKVIALHVYIRVQNLSWSVLCVPYEFVSFCKLNNFGFRVMRIIIIKVAAYAFILVSPFTQAIFVSGWKNGTQRELSRATNQNRHSDCSAAWVSLNLHFCQSSPSPIIHTAVDRRFIRPSSFQSSARRRFLIWNLSFWSHNLNYLYRVTRKSVKYFKNSQQINYATYHDNSYANRNRNSSSIV